MTNIQTKQSLSAIIIYHMWRNDAFTRFRCKHPFLTSPLAHKDNHNENHTAHKQTTYTWRITFLVYLPTATPNWMCCSPIHQNTKSDTGLIRKLRLKHPHTTHIGFDSEPQLRRCRLALTTLGGDRTNPNARGALESLSSRKNHKI